MFQQPRRKILPHAAAILPVPFRPWACLPPPSDMLKSRSWQLPHSPQLLSHRRIVYFLITLVFLVSVFMWRNAIADSFSLKSDAQPQGSAPGGDPIFNRTLGVFLNLLGYVYRVEIDRTRSFKISLLWSYLIGGIGRVLCSAPQMLQISPSPSTMP